MRKLDRILAAIDFSAAARTAFDRALWLSRANDAELLAVIAVPAERGFEWDARERIALIRSLRRAAIDAGVRFKISVQQGDPARVILLHARTRDVDLIVLGTNERTGLDRIRFGSVAETVALEAAQPVLVVPAGDRASNGDATPFKNVVVAVDLGEGSRAAIERGLSLTGADGRVTVLHVVRGLAHAGAHRYMYHLMEPEYQRQLARDARREIAALIPAEAARAQKVHVRIVTGDPSDEIARVASEAGADLILMGVRQRSAIGRRLFGSTATRVMRAAGVPVLALAA